MKFTYEITREKTKKMYMKNHRQINLIYLIMITMIFILITKDIVNYNWLFVLTIYIIIMIIFTLILYLINLVYASILTCKNKNSYGIFNAIINENGIKEKKTSINWNDVIDIRISKSKIIIKYKNNKNLTYVINKYFLENKNDFEKIVGEIKKYDKSK